MIYIHSIIPSLLNPVMIFIYFLILYFIFQKRWLLFLLVFLIILMSSPVISNLCIKYLEKEHPPIKIENLPKFENIVILRGVVKRISNSDGEIHYEFNDSVDRILVALKIFHLDKTKNIILTGGKKKVELRYR